MLEVPECTVSFALALFHQQGTGSRTGFRSGLFDLVPSGGTRPAFSEQKQRDGGTHGLPASIRSAAADISHLLKTNMDQLLSIRRLIYPNASNLSLFPAGGQGRSEVRPNPVHFLLV